MQFEHCIHSTCIITHFLPSLQNLAITSTLYDWKFELTLKAFANFSPGLRFGNPGKAHLSTERRKTLKGFAPQITDDPSQLLQSCFAPLETVSMFGAE
jgi:hypothetical protein